MFSIEVEFLTGRYTAHSKQGYGTTEWPPHPGRLYSALVAAYHEHGHGQQEREALEWLETLPPPKLSVPESRERDTVTVFVPHYDRDKIVDKDGREGLIPRFRVSSNRERTFPTVIPDDPVVYFIWDVDPPVEKQNALQRVVTSVPYLGHSSSLVRASVSTDPPEPTLVPRKSEEGKALRVPGEGRLADLERIHSQGRRPDPAAPVTYGAPQTREQTENEASSSNFSSGQDLLILEATGDVRLPLELTYDLTSSVRDAIISTVDDPVPAWISGHTPDGGVAERDHVAYLPLANIAHKWGNGSILGLAVALPSDVTLAQKQTVYEAIRDLKPIRLGSRGKMDLELTQIPTKTSLKRGAYVGPSRSWATVTPYVYDRFPDTRQQRDEMIAIACEHIGLARPPDVYVMENGVSPLVGVPNGGNFQLAEAGFSERPRYHVVLQFEKPVHGPVMIGRGRYFGIGLMRAIEEGDV